MKTKLFVLGLIIVCASSYLGFIYGKKIGYDNGSLAGIKVCKYLYSSKSPTPIQPSERALKAAAWVYTKFTPEKLSKLKKESPELGESPQDIVRNLAIYYDKSPESLSLVEAEMKGIGY